MQRREAFSGLHGSGPKDTQGGRAGPALMPSITPEPSQERGHGRDRGRQHGSRAQQRRSCGNCTGAQTCAEPVQDPTLGLPRGPRSQTRGRGAGKSQGSLSCGCRCELFCRHRRERPGEIHIIQDLYCIFILIINYLRNNLLRCFYILQELDDYLQLKPSIFHDLS